VLSRKSNKCPYFLTNDQDPSTSRYPAIGRRRAPTNPPSHPHPIHPINAILPARLHRLQVQLCILEPSPFSGLESIGKNGVEEGGMWVVKGGFVLVGELVGGGNGLVRLVVSPGRRCVAR